MYLIFFAPVFGGLVFSIVLFNTVPIAENCSFTYITVRLFHVTRINSIDKNKGFFCVYFQSRVGGTITNTHCSIAHRIHWIEFSPTSRGQRV